jgi:hypothetical protein
MSNRLTTIDLFTIGLVVAGATLLAMLVLWALGG